MGLTKTQSGGLADDAKTTINNNADNRVITGSGTANTLEGEAGFTFVAGSDPNLTLSGSGHPRINLTSTSGSDHTGINFGDNDDINAGMIQYTNSNNAMQFHTNGGEKMRLDSSGKVGIGMTTVGAALDVNGASGDTLRLSNGSALYQYRIGRNIADGKLEFRGTQSGDEVYSFGGVSGEKIRFQSGGGISFNGDTAAANALDDYEEGTWTPTAHGYTASNTSNNCFYTKIGRLVIATFRMTWPSLTNSASAEIRGLPFTARSQAVNTHGGAFAETNDNDNLSMIVQQNTTKMYILRCTSSGVDTQTVTEVSGKDFRGNVIYFTDA